MTLDLVKTCQIEYQKHRQLKITLDTLYFIKCKALYRKDTLNKVKKATHSVGENICKLCLIKD